MNIVDVHMQNEALMKADTYSTVGRAGVAQTRRITCRMHVAGGAWDALECRRLLLQRPQGGSH